MAEGGEIIGERETRFSITAGSEPVFDFYCELCREDGQTIEAEGYCVDCDDYLCSACYAGHRRSRPTRNHELLDKENMPKGTPLLHDRVSKEISTKCTQHKGKTVEFYCKSHDVLGCSTCIAMEHRNCDDIDCIRDKSDGLLDSQEYQEFIKMLNCLAQKSRDVIHAARENVSKADQNYSDVLKSIAQYRIDINTILDKLENDIKAKAETTNSEDVKKMKSVSVTCQSILETTEKTSTHVQNLQASKRVCQLYIAIKEAQREVAPLQTSLSKTENKNIVRTYKFEPNTKLKEFLSSPDAIGNISVQDPVKTQTNQTTTTGQKDVKATHVTDIDVRTSSDTTDCSITGSTVLSKQKIVIIDHNTDSLKLLDIQTQKLIGVLKFPKWCWDVTTVNEDQVAVSCYCEKKIRFVRVSDILKIEREITVNGRCHGIVYSKSRFVVTYDNPAKVEILDLTGKIIKRIENDNNGSPLFTCPRYVCVSKDDQTIYVSDCSSHKVTALTFDGTVKSVYSDSDLKGPHKVCVDHRGNVYICGISSKNIHMITPDFVKIKIILTQTDGLTSEVLSVRHCHETDRLFVGLYGNHLKIYQLS